MADEWSVKKVEKTDPWSVVETKRSRKSHAGGGDRKDKGLLRKVDAGVRGAADFLTFGAADEIAAGVSAIPALVTGGIDAARPVYDAELAAQQTRDRADRRDVPKSRIAGQAAGFGGTLATGAVLNVGRHIPRVAPAATGLARGAETVARNVFAGAAGGAAAGAASAEPGAQNRLAGAATGATWGAGFGAAAPVVGSVVGRGVRAVRNRLRPPAEIERGVNALARLLGPEQANPNAFRVEANRLRNNGETPALVDVMGESGRAVVRAGASRQTPARTEAQRFAEGRVTGLPDRISAQARRTISGDPRTPDQIRSTAKGQRKTKADAAFGAVRGEIVPLPNDVVTALRTPAGRDAVRRAAANARQSLRPETRSMADELDGLAERSLDQRFPKMSIGASQEVSAALYDAAEAQFRAGHNHQGTILKELAEAVRSNARSKVRGYDDALEGYAADSRLIEAAKTGEQFMTRNTDEFVSSVSGMDEQELALAKAAARRAIERQSGESIGAAPGVASRLANAPEQRARSAALLGSQAETMQEGMAAARELTDNANFIAPKGGSKTQGALQDAEAMKGFSEGFQAMRGGVTSFTFWLGNKLAGAGMNDAEAQALVRTAIDETRLDEAIEILARRMPADEARMVAEAIRTFTVRNSAENAVTPRVEAYLESDPSVYGAAY